VPSTEISYCRSRLVAIETTAVSKSDSDLKVIYQPSRHFISNDERYDNIYNFIRHLGSHKTLNNFTEKKEKNKSVTHSILTIFAETQDYV